MKRKIMIRFDDICPTMDWARWNKARAVLRQYNLKALIGVIPDCRDPDLQIDPPRDDFWEYVKQLESEGFAIAMHGYQHVFDSDGAGIVTRAPKSEFAGHSYQEQFEKIQKGKSILNAHGIQTETFFAPAHSYDETTLQALAANGFRYISDGKSSRPFIRKKIMCIPCKSSGCPKIGKAGYYTAVFHAHEWARPEKAYGFDQLENLCRRYHSEIVPFQEYSTRPPANGGIQRLEERIYLVYVYRIKPMLSKIKHRLKK